MAQSCPTLCDHVACQASLSITNSQSLLKHMFKESVKPSNYPSLCRPLLLMPSVFTSSRAFSNGLVLRIRWPKSWSFSFSINSPNDLLDWFTLGLTCLISLQSKRCSRVFSNTTVQKYQFFCAQLSSQILNTLQKPKLQPFREFLLFCTTFPYSVANHFISF